MTLRLSEVKVKKNAVTLLSTPTVMNAETIIQSHNGEWTLYVEDLFRGAYRQQTETDLDHDEFFIDFLGNSSASATDARSDKEVVYTIASVDPFTAQTPVLLSDNGNTVNCSTTPHLVYLQRAGTALRNVSTVCAKLPIAYLWLPDKMPSFVPIAGFGTSPNFFNWKEEGTQYVHPCGAAVIKCTYLKTIVTQQTTPVILHRLDFAYSPSRFKSPEMFLTYMWSTSVLLPTVVVATKALPAASLVIQHPPPNIWSDDVEKSIQPMYNRFVELAKSKDTSTRTNIAQMGMHAILALKYAAKALDDVQNMSV